VEDVGVPEDLLVLVVVGLLVPVPTAVTLKVGTANDIVGLDLLLDGDDGDDGLGLDPPPEPPLTPAEQVLLPTVQDVPSAQPSLHVSLPFWLL
jgi:hypothetical protein